MKCYQPSTAIDVYARYSQVQKSMNTRLYARYALRRMRVYVIKREIRLKALALLLLCYSRTHHSIVDSFGLGILSEVSTGNTLLQFGFEVAC